MRRLLINVYVVESSNRIVMFGLAIIFAIACLAQTSSYERSERMLDGVEIPIEDVPFQGSVETFGIHRCSAAILSSKYALITAVCSDYFSVDIYIATLRFGTATRLYDGKAYRCGGLTIHPKFDQYNNTFEQKDYDVAIVEIFPELDIDNVTIKPIALPNSAPSVGTSARVSGWGSITDGGPIMVYLRATDVAVTNQAACETAFQDVFPVTDRMVCAGNPNGVTCDGEQGSLLVVNNTVVGLSSWGYGCGKVGKPDVYVNLANSEIRDFIRNVTGI